MHRNVPQGGVLFEHIEHIPTADAGQVQIYVFRFRRELEDSDPDLWLVVLEYLLPRLSSSTEAPALLKETIARLKAGDETGEGLLSGPRGGVQDVQQRIVEAVVKLRGTRP